MGVEGERVDSVLLRATIEAEREREVYLESGEEDRESSEGDKDHGLERSNPPVPTDPREREHAE